MKKYIKASDQLSININWEDFMDYYNVSLEQLIMEENSFDEDSVEEYIELQIEAVMDDNAPTELSDFAEQVVEYALNLDNVSDYCAGLGISDAGLLIGIQHFGSDAIIGMCEEALS